VSNVLTVRDVHSTIVTVHGCLRDPVNGSNDVSA
jgi:hypothetical protein